jgi:hypothetical protein
MEIDLKVGQILYQGERQESIVIIPISASIENKAPAEPEFDDAIDF